MKKLRFSKSISPCNWIFARDILREIVAKNTGVKFNFPSLTVYNEEGVLRKFVADCGQHEYSKANARLISAAPNLLKALKACVKYMKEKGVSHEYPVMINALVAIKKAEKSKQEKI